MAVDPCNPCGCAGAFVNDIVSFRMAVLNALCGISSGGIPAVPPAAAAATTQADVAVIAGVVPTQVLAANANRIGGWVKNDSDSEIFVSFGAAASLTAPTRLMPGAALAFGTGYVYTGVISAIHAELASKNVEVVEF